MRIVLAVGGNALSPRGGSLDAAAQLAQVRAAGPGLAELAAQHQLVVVHGNGPQVGLLAQESSADPSLTAAYPLDDLVAETQGVIGYWLQQTISSCGGGAALTLVSQTVVDEGDPAFADPAKFIGPAYEHDEARSLADRNGWTVKRDGRVWRRVVPSPAPQDLVELALVGTLLDLGVTVVVAGGGGIPVVRSGPVLRGVEAVVDKDLVAGLLARRLDADLLVVVTDVPAVMRHFGTSGQTPIADAEPDDLEHLELPAGSMGPKVAAAVEFVRRTGKRAAIGSLDALSGVVAGTSGTQIRPSSGPRADGHRDVRPKAL